MWLQVKWTKPVSLEGSGSDKRGWVGWRLRGNGLQSGVTWQGFQKTSEALSPSRQAASGPSKGSRVASLSIRG